MEDGTQTGNSDCRAGIKFRQSGDYFRLSFLFTGFSQLLLIRYDIIKTRKFNFVTALNFWQVLKAVSIKFLAVAGSGQRKILQLF
jgi:hypothetical protein